MNTIRLRRHRHRSVLDIIFINSITIIDRDEG
jgi:hypothetical protein